MTTKNYPKMSVLGTFTVGTDQPLELLAERENKEDQMVRIYKLSSIGAKVKSEMFLVTLTDYVPCAASQVIYVGGDAKEAQGVWKDALKG